MSPASRALLTLQSLNTETVARPLSVSYGHASLGRDASGGTALDLLLFSKNPRAAFASAKPFNLAALAAIFWAALAAAMIVRQVVHPHTLYLSTDDAMRLTEVRDWLAGQSWFDTTQHRMNTPYGLPMHWSRIIDAGIGGLILLFRLVMNPKSAEMTALCLWPVLPLLPCFAAIARLGVRLAGYAAGIAALLLMASCVYVTGYFQPGSIDHHNVHMALTLWGVVFLLDLERYAGAAIGAGLVSAASLAIGLETFPYLLLISALIAYFWITRGNAIAAPVRNFGLVFAGTAAALLLGATSTIERLGTACDTYSALFGILAIAGGAGLAALTLVPALGTSLARRAGGFAVLAIALLALAYVTGPDCLYGPYAHVDARLDHIWLSRIEEVLSPLATAWYEPGTFFSSYIYACIGFAASIVSVFLVPRENREAMIILCLFAATALAITTAEVRGMPFAILFVLPGLGVAITQSIARYARTPLMAVAATIAALVLFSEMTFDIEGQYLVEGRTHVSQRNKVRNNAGDCMRAYAVKQLATLPAGRVAAMVDQGPAILAYSKHAMIGGPYHRNARGILDTYDLFTSKPEAGAHILRERGIDYLMTCRSSPDYTFYLNEDKGNGLLKQLDKNHPPAWLAPIPKADEDQKVQIYRVLRENLP